MQGAVGRAALTGCIGQNQGVSTAATTLAATVERRGDALRALNRSIHTEPESELAFTDLPVAEGFEIELGVAGLDTTLTFDALPEAGHASGYEIVAEAVDVTIKLTGTPAEEFGEGEVLLRQRGVFGNVAMMVHSAPAVDHQPEFAVACAIPSAAQRDQLIGAQRQRRSLGAGGVG
jgi:hypothetical protein